MNNKGFTLIELLGVIIVLGVLVTIVSVTVTKVLKDSETKLTEVQIEKLKDAAKNYYINEGMDDIDFEQNNFSHCVNINYLIKNGYIDENEISNFETGEDMLGSIKIHYENKKYKYTYTEDSCKICTLINDAAPTGISVGDKYQCKVKDDMEKDFEDGYYFYVLGTNEDGTINLIMDRNINSDGTPVTKVIKKETAENGIYNIVEWVSKLDYNDDINYGTNGNNNKGPITAINYLNKSTSTWINIPNLDITYNDEGENFTNFKITGKARLPYHSEVNNAGCKDYEELSCPIWMIDYLKAAESGNYQENSIAVLYGYWTFSSGVNDDAWYIYYKGNVGKNYVNGNQYLGVRPAITLPKNRFEDGNW